MEETVSVLIWECWLWEDTMDMIDWARLLLAGSLETGGEGRRRSQRGSREPRGEQLCRTARTPVAPSPALT